MKVGMKSISVYGMQKDRKKIMEFLQKKGAAEFKSVEEDGLEKLNVNDSILSFERYIANAKRALEILNVYAPVKSPMFSMRKTLPMTQFSMDTQEASVVGGEILNILSSDKKIEEEKMEITRLKLQIEAMERWKLLDIPLSFSGTSKTKAALHTLPFEADAEHIASMLGGEAENVYVEVICHAGDMTGFFILYLKEDADDIEKAIREAGFAQLPFSLSHLPPAEKIKQLSDKVSSLEDDVTSLTNKLKEYGKKRDTIELFLDHTLLRRDKYLALMQIGQTEKTFVIEGYIPEPAADKLRDDLMRSAVCAVQIDDIPDTEEAPVLLKNNAFAEPVEGITSTYSVPSRFDVDPNFIMAIFYYIFFGMMFSDAGYGLMVMLVTGYLSFFAKVEKKTKLTMRMFFFCGVSTTFWGIMYGSFFGDAVTQVGKTFFGHPEWKFPALWLDPVSDPLRLLIVSVIIGVVQIITGLVLAFHTNWHKGEKMAALFDIGTWILIILGIGAFAAGMALKESLSPTLYQILNYGGIGLIAVGVIGIILMKGRETKNPLLRIGNGVLGLYDVTSYVSDALSYSRLMALGLSTGVIAQVVNTMGTLAGNSVIGVIAFILIFIFGHLINFAINMLGAYVHTNRLQYVEFFGKFYEGGGKAFSPLQMNTQYYIFEEDK